MSARREVIMPTCAGIIFTRPTTFQVMSLVVCKPAIASIINRLRLLAFAATSGCQVTCRPPEFRRSARRQGCTVASISRGMTAPPPPEHFAFIA